MKLVLGRRKVLAGLIAAPAIVSFGSIMPVRGKVLERIPYVHPIMESFLKFQNTPYYDRMAPGIVLEGPERAVHQIMQFREMPGHVMGPDLRRFANYKGKFQSHHDEHLRQQIREAIHAARLKNEA